MSVKSLPDLVGLHFQGEPLPFPTYYSYPGAYWNPLPEKISEFISGHSWKPDCPLAKEDLAYVQVLYHNDERHQRVGELIVHRGIAEKTIVVFQKIFKQFPIQQMRLVDYYGADDEKSMQANNSSAFCSRKIYNTDRYSNHSWGCAIDLNPKINPYYIVDTGKVFPEGSDPYINRDQDIPGMIHPEEVVVQAFKEQGFSWGGDWVNRKDWQHFEYPKESLGLT